MEEQIDGFISGPDGVRGSGAPGKVHRTRVPAVDKVRKVLGPYSYVKELSKKVPGRGLEKFFEVGVAVGHEFPYNLKKMGEGKTVEIALKRAQMGTGEQPNAK